MGGFEGTVPLRPKPPLILQVCGAARGGGECICFGNLEPARSLWAQGLGFEGVVFSGG